jgi:hypothetical protein
MFPIGSRVRDAAFVMNVGVVVFVCPSGNVVVEWEREGGCNFMSVSELIPA